MFTDWLAKTDANDDPDGKKFRFSGVAEVRRRISDYLLKYKVFTNDEKEELHRVLNTKWEN